MCSFSFIIYFKYENFIFEKFETVKSQGTLLMQDKVNPKNYYAYNLEFTGREEKGYRKTAIAFSFSPLGMLNNIQFSNTYTAVTVEYSVL